MGPELSDDDLLLKILIPGKPLRKAMPATGSDPRCEACRVRAVKPCLPPISQRIQRGSGWRRIHRQDFAAHS